MSSNQKHLVRASWGFACKALVLCATLTSTLVITSCQSEQDFYGVYTSKDKSSAALIFEADGKCVMGTQNPCTWKMDNGNILFANQQGQEFTVVIVSKELLKIDTLQLFRSKDTPGEYFIKAKAEEQRILAKGKALKEVGPKIESILKKYQQAGENNYDNMGGFSSWQAIKFTPPGNRISDNEYQDEILRITSNAGDISVILKESIGACPVGTIWRMYFAEAAYGVGYDAPKNVACTNLTPRFKTDKYPVGD
jgi:hypothetical protein